ncbi:unnamed protein product [Jaminaea pallidilutea]
MPSYRIISRRQRDPTPYTNSRNLMLPGSAKQKDDAKQSTSSATNGEPSHHRGTSVSAPDVAPLPATATSSSSSSSSLAALAPRRTALAPADPNQSQLIIDLDDSDEEGEAEPSTAPTCSTPIKFATCVSRHVSQPQDKVSIETLPCTRAHQEPQTSKTQLGAVQVDVSASPAGSPIRMDTAELDMDDTFKWQKGDADSSFHSCHEAQTFVQEGVEAYNPLDALLPLAPHRFGNFLPLAPLPRIQYQPWDAAERYSCAPTAQLLEQAHTFKPDAFFGNGMTCVFEAMHEDDKDVDDDDDNDDNDDDMAIGQPAIQAPSVTSCGPSRRQSANKAPARSSRGMQPYERAKTRATVLEDAKAKRTKVHKAKFAASAKRAQAQRQPQGVLLGRLPSFDGFIGQQSCNLVGRHQSVLSRRQERRHQPYVASQGKIRALKAAKLERHASVKTVAEKPDEAYGSLFVDLDGDADMFEVDGSIVLCELYHAKEELKASDVAASEDTIEDAVMDDLSASTLDSASSLLSVRRW